MRKFYEVNTHELCEGIIEAIRNGQRPSITEEEIMAVAIKLLWLEQDYAYIRSMASVKVRSQENYKNYRVKTVTSGMDRILEAAGVK